MSADDTRPGEPHRPPAPNLGGFGPRRGAGLAGLVSNGQPAPPATPPGPPPSPEPESAAGGSAADSVESAAAATPASPPQTPRTATAPPAAQPTAPPPTNGIQPGPPAMAVDQNDPTALVITPTVLSVPEPLMRRFERARRTADSNTAVVLDALRAHAHRLPHLVTRARRPAPPSGQQDLFPWRTSARPAKGAPTRVRRVQLPIRPLAGELQVIDSLVNWVEQEIGAASRSLGGRATRSEVVVAALDAYLPQERRRA